VKHAPRFSSQMPDDAAWIQPGEMPRVTDGIRLAATAADRRSEALHQVIPVPLAPVSVTSPVRLPRGRITARVLPLAPQHFECRIQHEYRIA
jgi:hypothetical protein